MGHGWALAVEVTRAPRMKQNVKTDSARPRHRARPPDAAVPHARHDD